jgi:type II secretory ATPase GspE/PulE/Tfp pilus assembly ATPase PilB-like protein
MHTSAFLLSLLESLAGPPPTKSDPSLAAASLPFNPIRLLALIIWVYLCLYCVQLVRSSALVPAKYKPIAALCTLFAGPLLLIILVIVNAAGKSVRGDQSTFDLIKQQLRDMAAAIRAPAFAHRRDDPVLRLLDSAGRSIDEIYGHSESRRRDARILDLTEKLIAQALDLRASDILIDPADESLYTIRFRIDGVLRKVRRLKSQTCKAVVNSIKAVSGMDIAEKRRPQDGAFIAKRGRTTASFRVASAGALGGEKLSVRILNPRAATFAVTEVGFTKKQHAIILEALKKPSGMILMCGPTGSGKTTTLYAMLNEIDRHTRNVITVEDPIEAMIPEASQIEINPRADITFAKTLRSVLRQDPDVICVGEIRDEETAEIALRASQTGHLVLATVHSDSHSGALIRLLDLGVSPILMSSGLSMLISQRLLRRLCDRCKKPAELTDGLIREFREKGIDYSTMFAPAGCRRCGGTGYSGRVAICDVMVVTEQLKADIASAESLIEYLRNEGKRKDRTNLRKQGLNKIARGITSLEELKRVIG